MPLNIIEELVLSLIKSYKVEDLKYAADRGISIKETLLNFAPSYVFFARITGAMYRSDADNLNYENLIGWLRYSRPDLCELIESSQLVRTWFRRQLKEMKELIWGDGL